MIKVLSFFLIFFCSFFYLGCSGKGSKSLLIEKTVKCLVPIQSDKGSAESGVEDVPVTVKIGFKSKEQRKSWGDKKGFPFAQVINGKSVIDVPIAGLSGEAIHRITPQWARQ